MFCGQARFAFPCHDLTGGNQGRDMPQKRGEPVCDKTDDYRAYGRYEGKGRIRLFPMLLDIKLNCKIENLAGVRLVVYILVSKITDIKQI